MTGGPDQASWLRTAVDDLLDDLTDRAGRSGACALPSAGGTGPRDLGPALLADTTVVPIAVFDREVLELREAEGLEPALDRLTLHTRLELDGWEARSPVESVMFLGLLGRTGLTSLARLGGYGQVTLLSSQTQGISTVDLAECDWRGIGVFVPSAQRATDGVTARGGWLLQPERAERQRLTNLRYEQLVDLACRRDVPAPANRPFRQ